MGSLQLMTSKNWRYHANILRILEVIKNEVVERNWLLSDWEGNTFPKGYSQEDREIILDGQETLEVFHDDFQLIWGVLSGSKSQFTSSDLIPYAKSNDDLWNPFYKIQNMKADIEIVVWDSSFTLISADDESILRRLQKAFGDGTAFFTDCLKPVREYYKGQTVNEMLLQAGFESEFYKKIESGKLEEAASILYSLGFNKDNVQNIIQKAKNA